MRNREFVFAFIRTSHRLERFGIHSRGISEIYHPHCEYSDCLEVETLFEMHMANADRIEVREVPIANVIFFSRSALFSYVITNISHLPNCTSELNENT